MLSGDQAAHTETWAGVSQSSSKSGSSRSSSNNSSSSTTLTWYPGEMAFSAAVVSVTRLTYASARAAVALPGALSIGDS